MFIYYYIIKYIILSVFTPVLPVYLYSGQWFVKTSSRGNKSENTGIVVICNILEKEITDVVIYVVVWQETITQPSTLRCGH